MIDFYVVLAIGILLKEIFADRTKKDEERKTFFFLSENVQKTIFLFD